MRRTLHPLPILAAGALAGLLAGGCISEYMPRLTSAAESLPVIEGIIVEGETVIKLGSSVGLDGSAYDDWGVIWDIDRWSGSRVWVEGENGDRFESAGPDYDGITHTIPIDRLDENTRYRLVVENPAAGVTERYESQWRRPQSTPPVESVDLACAEGDRSVKVRINTVGRPGDTGYYFWAYEEVWEVHAERNAYSYYGLWEGDYTQYSLGEADFMSEQGQHIELFDYTGPYSPFYYGWKYDRSRELILAATERLSSNVVRDHILYEIDVSDSRLSDLYHTRVMQYAVAADAYYYFDNLRKNTDQAGSIFAPIPSEMQGNIICTTSPERNVIGFIEVSKLAEHEMFIEDSPLYVKPYTFCPSITDSDDDPNFAPWNMYPVYDGSYTYRRCIDVLQYPTSATKTRPDWWPNDHV